MITYTVTACDADGEHTRTTTGNPDDALMEFERLIADPSMTNVLLTKADDTTVYKVREYSRDLDTGYSIDATSLLIGTHQEQETT